MEIYESEKDQLEAIKKWWQENGRVILAGLVLGLGAVGGWRFWQAHTIATAEQASALYERLSALEQRPYAETKPIGDMLLQEFPSSGYAALAALILANSAYLDQQPDEARRHLEWAMEKAKREEVRLVARLRLARLLLDQGEHEAALGLLDNAAPGAFRAGYEETRGDILLVQGKSGPARSAYLRSLSDPNLTPGSRDRVQMKLHDLGEAVPGAGAAPREAES